MPQYKHALTGATMSLTERQAAVYPPGVWELLGSTSSEDREAARKAARAAKAELPSDEELKAAKPKKPEAK